MKFIGRSVGRLLRGIALLWQVCVCGLANLVRRLSKGSWADYVLFELSGPLLERTPQRPGICRCYRSAGRPSRSNLCTMRCGGSRVILMCGGW